MTVAVPVKLAVGWSRHGDRQCAGGTSTEELLGALREFGPDRG